MLYCFETIQYRHIYINDGHCYWLKSLDLWVLLTFFFIALNIGALLFTFLILIDRCEYRIDGFEHLLAVAIAEKPFLKVIRLDQGELHCLMYNKLIISIQDQACCVLLP